MKTTANIWQQKVGINAIVASFVCLWKCRIRSNPKDFAKLVADSGRRRKGEEEGGRGPSSLVPFKNRSRINYIRHINKFLVFLCRVYSPATVNSVILCKKVTLYARIGVFEKQPQMAMWLSAVPRTSPLHELLVAKRLALRILLTCAVFAIHPSE